MVSENLNKSKQQGPGSPECCFLPPQSPRGANQWHLLRVEMGLIKLLGVRWATPCQGASPRPAVSLQVSAAGGLWRRRQCMKQAASSLAGHIRQSDALKGREGSWWSTLERGRPRQLQLGEEQTRKPWQRQLQPAACVYTSSPKDTDGKLGQVSGDAVEQCLLGLDSFCLHFTSC